MDDHLTPDSSSLSQYSAFCPDFNGQDDSVSRSQAEYSLGNIRMEGSSNTPGSSLHPPDPYVPYQGSYSSIPHPVPNILNNQWPSYSQPPFRSEDHPHAKVQVPDPHYPNDIDPIYPARWGGTNTQMGQGRIDHLLADNSLPSATRDSQGASGPSDPPGPPYTMNSGTLLPSSELYQHQQSQVQYDYPYATSSTHGQVEGATQSLVVTHATTQETSMRRERKAQEKKERDKARKQTERSNDERDYLRICELLDIPYAPKNTLVNRIRGAVEELVERHNIDNDLRQRVKNTEDYAYLLKAKLTELFNGEDIDSFLPLNAYSTLGDPGASVAQR